MPREPLVIGPFAGGLNTYDDPTAVKDTELVEALNWDPGLEGSLRSRPPFQNIFKPLPLGVGGGMKFLGFFYGSASTYHLIASDGISSTWAFNGTAWSLITSTFSASAIAQFDNKAWLTSPVGEVDPGGYWTPGGGFVADADMPRGDTIVSFKSRLWVSPGKGNANGTRVYYSKVLGQPNFWQSPSFVDVGQGDGQEVVLLTTYYNTLVAFRTQSIYAFSFNADPAQGSVALLVPGVGLTSKDCLIAYENYLYFMYDEKAYAFINNSAQQINLKVPFTATSQANITIPFSVSLFNNRAIFHYYDTMYVYSLRTKTWTRWKSPEHGAIGQIMSPQGILTDEAYVNSSALVSTVPPYLTEGFEAGVGGFVAGAGTTQLASTNTPRTGLQCLANYRTATAGAVLSTRSLTGLTVGAMYKVSIWMRCIGAPTAAYVGITGIGASPTVTPTTSYQELTYTFTATATTHVLELGGASPAGGTTDVMRWDDLSVTVVSTSKLLYIEEQFTNATESYTCEVQTKNYNYQLSSNFKRLFWWGVDAVFRTRIRGWAVPVVHHAQVTWGQLYSQGVTWGQLLGGTWGSPFIGDLSVNSDYNLEGTGPMRKFVKMYKSMRFRQIYFKVIFDTDGSIGTAPVNLFTITAYVGTKETVSKTVS
jgi:hypothetical protein